MNDAWRVDRSLFDKDAMPLLREHGHAIGELADAGNEQAQQIMRLYEMLRRSFDPITHHRLRLSLYEVKQGLQKKKPASIETGFAVR